MLSPATRFNTNRMKQLLPGLLGLLFLTLFAGAYYYISRRFGLYFEQVPQKAFYILFAGLVVFMIVGLAAFTNSSTLAGQVVYITSACIMGFLIHLLLALLLVDLFRLGVKIPASMGGITALSLAVLISVFAVLNAFNVRTREVNLEVDGLQKEIRLMHWTDVHLGHFRGPAFLNRLVEMSNAEKVDAVMITGDLFDGKIRLENGCLEALGQLKMPVYFVAGNHDGYSGVQEVKDLLKEQGVKVLSNQVDQFGELQIVGLNHMVADENSTDMHAMAGGRATIRSALDSLNLNRDKPSILLHHSPHGIKYASEAGIDLYLSGHTHGGQLFPITLIGNLLYEYNRGLHDYKGTKIYVGEGAGTFGPPMRTGTRSTITLFSLQPGKS